MSSPLVWLCLLQWPASSLLQPTPQEEISPWVLGCVDSSVSSALGLQVDRGVRGLDPVNCSVLCLHQGYEVAAWTFDYCYCSSPQQLHGLVVGENSTGGLEDRGKNGRPRVQHCSVGHGQGTVIFYKTKATLLHHISLSTPADRVHPGKSPTLEPSGLLDRVKIYAANRAHPTNTEITLRAVVEATDSAAEFIWSFGDSTSVRTNRRTVTKRYHRPGRFDVTVLMTDGHSSITSQLFPLLVQRAVRLNRLVHQASVLQNQTVELSCQVTIGTDLTFLWSFGDGMSRLGQSTEQHVFKKVGEWTVRVTVFNLVSSASLSSHIFVLDRPCQPPPVKNLGPLKLQVRRYEVVRVGVTFDTELDCDSAAGLNYSWTLLDSSGRAFELPLTDTHRQTLTLQSLTLQYDTYTATARVQVIGTVVYNNYSVEIEVVPSPPVAVIQGGTNLFIDTEKTAIISLDGTKSYDPDLLTDPLSYSWTCKPLSSIPVSCFHPAINLSTSSPVLMFPAHLLKENFDQFQFTLSVNSGERSASSETFITVTPNIPGQMSVHCHTCDGNQMNWDQMSSISASCEDCGVPPEHQQYRWSLYLLTVASTGDTEAPFCYAADLGVPSTIIQGYSSSPQMSETRVFSESRGWEPTLSPVDSEDHRSTEALLSEHVGQRSDFGEFPLSYSSPEWGLSSPDLGSGDVASGLGELDVDYDTYFLSAMEGDPGSSAGRPTGVDGETLSPGHDPVFGYAAHKSQGSNLVVSVPFHETVEPTLLDLPREPVTTALFESYTYSGLSSSVLRLRPFSLKAGSRYMLDVTAKFQDHFVGRTQLFLETKPTPKGLRCQVQPMTGAELHTHFSVFCASGKKDLLYEYSFSVGDQPARVLHQSRDFQYYFSLPSGDPADDFKVTIYIRVKSSTYWSSTQPCPVTVQVRPSFIRNDSSPSTDPDRELSEVGLRNLLALLKLGNSAEVCNYISVLCSILNRLSLDAQANATAQTHVRSVLICTLCQLWSSDQALWVDTIDILQELLQVTHQVTLASVRHVTSQILMISDQFLDHGTSARFHLDHQTINSLVVILSYNMEAVTGQHLTYGKPCKDNNRQDSGSVSAENTRNISSRCITAGSGSDGPRQEEELTTQVVVNVLHIAAELMLKYVLFNNIRQHTAIAGPMTLHVALLNQTSVTVSGGSTTVFMPPPLLHRVFVRHGRTAENRWLRPCVVSLMTELRHNPYTCTHCSTQLRGPVVDLSLYECRRRRKIPVPFLALPIDIRLQPQPEKESLTPGFTLLHSQINYHSFNITQQDLQRSIQLNVVFTSTARNPFPIIILFRMFEKPTPSMHHLERVHNWESNSSRFTLPPSYLSAAGVGYLALLNADFEKPPRSKRLSEPISYNFSVISSQCLSWDHHQGVWAPGGCKTQQGDGSSAVNCSCHQLRPLTVTQNQIWSSHHSEDLNMFRSDSSDPTVVVLLLLLLLCCYIPGLLVCRRVDDTNRKNQRVHYLPDNSPSDLYFYIVTIHTGLCSAAVMSAKVYMVLHGDDGFSNTRQLQAPGCTPFRRNTRDTFILSTAESLGSVWGMHIWHDNSGPSPSWYLQQVEVSEVGRPGGIGCAWLLRGQCWLAVDEGDGLVERMLRVCTGGLSFPEVLSATLSDFLADFHIWMSVYSCPCPNHFSRAQRLSVCLLLLLGYACVNAVILSQTDEELPLDLGILDWSAVSVETGLWSVAAVLPGATAISALFRLRKVKLIRSGVQRGGDRRREGGDLDGDVHVGNNRIFHTSWLSLWIQEAWKRKHQGGDLVSVSSPGLQMKRRAVSQSDVAMTNVEVKQRKIDGTLKMREDIEEITSVLGKQGDKETDEVTQMKIAALQESSPSSQGVDHMVHAKTPRKKVPSIKWWRCLAWVLCLLCSLFCLILSSVLGMRFNSSRLLLWVQALVFSLVSCIFLIHPAVILAAAVTVSLWCRPREGFLSFSLTEDFEQQFASFDCTDSPENQHRIQPNSCFEELLAARQRARYLRLVRPPVPAELKRSRERMRRERLLSNTLRDWCLCVSMILLLLCVTNSSSNSNLHLLNQSVREHISWNIGEKDFVFRQNHGNWLRWSKNHLLNVLYQKASTETENHHRTLILTGQPILWETRRNISLWKQTFSLKFPSESPQTASNAALAPPAVSSCALPAVSLGHTRSEAETRLNQLRSSGGLDNRTVALKVHFTLFSPALNLFTSVTLLTQQGPVGQLSVSSKVQSVQVHQTPGTWDYVVMGCQLLFLLLSLLHLCLQMCSLRQQGLMGYWKTPRNWLEVTLLTVTVVRHLLYIRCSVLVMEVSEQLQRHEGQVDVSSLASWKQDICALHGLMLFLLTLKSASILWPGQNSGLTKLLSRLIWPMVVGVILLVALSCAGTLLFIQRSWSFSSNLHSVHTLLCHHRGFRPVKNLLISGWYILYWGILYLSSKVVLMALVAAVVSSLIRSSRRSQTRRKDLTLTDLCRYVKDEFWRFLLKSETHWTDDHVESRTYYLEEVEGLVDELLFRLNALTDSLHHTLPAKPHHSMEGESPITTPTMEQNYFHIQIQDILGFQEEEGTPRSKPEAEWTQLPQEDCHLRNTNLLETEPDCNYHEQKYWNSPVSRELQMCQTGTYDSWSAETQGGQTEVVVEVLLHGEPTGGLLDNI